MTMYQPLLWLMPVERAKEKGISVLSSEMSDAIFNVKKDRNAIAVMILTLTQIDRMLTEKELLGLDKMCSCKKMESCPC